MELHEALILVERGIIELLCNGLNRTGVQELRAQAEAQRLAISTNDQELSNRIGGVFHELLGQLSRNRVIEEVHGNLLERTRILQMLYRRDFDEAHLCDEHTRLVECIENGNMEEARQLMKDHYWRILRSYRFDDVATEGASVFEALNHIGQNNSHARQGEMA